MIEIGEALKQWRQNASELRNAGPDGMPIRVCLDTDSDSSTAEFPRITMSLAFGTSETTAVIPFVLTDEVEVSEETASVLKPLIKTIQRLYSGKSYFCDYAIIHALTLKSIETDIDVGMMKKARITWSGQGSVKNG